VEGAKSEEAAGVGHIRIGIGGGGRTWWICGGRQGQAGWRGFNGLPPHRHRPVLYRPCYCTMRARAKIPFANRNRRIVEGEPESQIHGDRANEPPHPFRLRGQLPRSFPAPDPGRPAWAPLAGHRRRGARVVYRRTGRRDLESRRLLLLDAAPDPACPRTKRPRGFCLRARGRPRPDREARTGVRRARASTTSPYHRLPTAPIRRVGNRPISLAIFRVFKGVCVYRVRRAGCFGPAAGWLVRRSRARAMDGSACESAAASAAARENTAQRSAGRWRRDGVGIADKGERRAGSAKQCVARASGGEAGWPHAGSAVADSKVPAPPQEDNGVDAGAATDGVR
jgi:hypothetical protein